MKRLVSYFLILILVVFAILTAIAAALQFLDLDPYRNRIANLATEAIGRQVRINGHIDINLFPQPEVILNDVSLANAPWGSNPTMATVQHVDAVFSFPSLFSETIIVRRVRLNDVMVLLEKNDRNLGNWVMGTAEPSAKPGPEKAGRVPDETGSLPVIIDSAEIRNVTLTVRAPEGTGQVYRLSSLKLQSEESGNLILHASGEMLGDPLELHCRILSKASVAAQGDPPPLIGPRCGNADQTDLCRGGA